MESVAGSMAREFRIHGERSAADDDEKQQAHDHAEIGAAYMHGGPEAGFHQHGKFGSGYGHRDVNEQRNGRKTREQSDDKQEAAGDFHRSDERCEEVRGGNANLRKAAHAERGGKEELLNAFGEKNPAHQDANEDHGRGRAGTQQPALD